MPLSTIADRYELQEEIGIGGMGVVYKAEDSQAGVSVAVKQLKTEVLENAPGLVERFRREGEALRQLNHPNIVKMLDMVEDGEDYYLIVEYMPGGDLHQLLAAGQLSISRTVKIALEIADALTRSHHLKIIHRDLKPGNVLLADDGTPRLSDFGVAHLATKDRVTATNAVVGTIDYLAPEVLNGNAADVRSDIWSFGVMLYEMVAGVRPFTGDNIGQIITAILTQPVPYLEEFRPDAPVALIDLISRMLQKDPDSRISSVRLVGAELEALLLGTDTDSGLRTPVTPPQPGRFAQSTPQSLSVKNNLPVQTTSFVGREPELDEIGRLLDDPEVRLLTIVAPGGMGKTRLSLEAAGQQLGNYDDGVYFAELAPLTDPATIPSAIAEIVGLQFSEAPIPPAKQLAQYLTEKSMLLVIDNWEHVITGVSVLSTILHTAPNIKVLATSRERLQLSGETVLMLGGMDFPDWETPEDALQYGAVTLFMQSAHRVVPDFELQQDDLAHVAKICRMVQGMPLGIVLAAAWLDTLSLEDIVEEISQSYDILETEMRDVPERHRSIRAVFEYSWNLMPDKDRDAFSRLAIFRGGFTRQAAQKVSGANLRSLTSLVNKSLISRNSDTGRYTVHELLRQFGEEQLEQTGQLAELKQAHAEHFAHFMATWLQQGSVNINFKPYLEDYENIRAAWYWLVDQGDMDTLNVMAFPYYSFTRSVQRYFDGLQLVSYARDKFEVPIEEATHPLQKFVFTHYIEMLPDIEERLQRAIPIAKNSPEIPHLYQYVLFASGVFTMMKGDFQKAVEHLEKASTETEGAVPVQVSVSKWYLFVAQAMIGNFDISLAQSRQFSQHPNPFLRLNGSLQSVYLNITSGYVTGDFQPAWEALQVAKDVTQQMGNNPILIVRSLIYEARLNILNGDVAMTEEIAYQALSMLKENNVGQIKRLIETVRVEATLFNHDIDTARRQLAVTMNLPRITNEPVDEARWSHAVMSVIDGQGEQALKSITQYFTRDAVMTAARYPNKFGEAAYIAQGITHIIAAGYALLGEHETAAGLLGKIDSMPDRPTHWVENLSVFTELPGKLLSALGNDTYEAAYERGKSVDLRHHIPKLTETYRPPLGMLH